MSEKKYQDELDLSSPNFDALKALKNPDKVKIPYPLAPVLDNVFSFVETPDGIFPKQIRERKPVKPKSPSPEAGTSKEQVEVETKKGTWQAISDLSEVSD